MNVVVRCWLALYNQVSGIGWLLILVTLLCGGLSDAWAQLGWIVIGLQTLCLFDLVHAVFGLWPVDEHISLISRLWCKVGHRSEMFISIALADAAVLASPVFG